MMNSRDALSPEILRKASRIELLLTDCDGVLTDAGVYYSAEGEALKRFSMRDGMGFERLRKLANVDAGIITGENSPIVSRRAEKLKVKELHLGIKNKLQVLQAILQERNLQADQVAFIGDDMNDLEIMSQVGLTACPADALPPIKAIADYTCTNAGGHGAFREFAELVILAKSDASNVDTAATKSGAKS